MKALKIIIVLLVLFFLSSTACADIATGDMMIISPEGRTRALLRAAGNENAPIIGAYYRGVAVTLVSLEDPEWPKVKIGRDAGQVMGYLPLADLAQTGGKGPESAVPEAVITDPDGITMEVSNLQLPDRLSQLQLAPGTHILLLGMSRGLAHVQALGTVGFIDPDSFSLADEADFAELEADTASPQLTSVAALYDFEDQPAPAAGMTPEEMAAQTEDDDSADTLLDLPESEVPSLPSSDAAPVPPAVPVPTASPIPWEFFGIPAPTATPGWEAALSDTPQASPAPAQAIFNPAVPETTAVPVWEIQSAAPVLDSVYSVTPAPTATPGWEYSDGLFTPTPVPTATPGWEYSDGLYTPVPAVAYFDTPSTPAPTVPSFDTPTTPVPTVPYFDTPVTPAPVITPLSSAFTGPVGQHDVADWPLGDDPYYYTVYIYNPYPTDRLHLREGPASSSRSLGKYYNGTRAALLQDYSSEWAYVRIGTLQGYMKQEYLRTAEAAPPSAMPVMTVSNSNSIGNLHLRAYPYLDAQSLGVYPNGTKVILMGFTEEWAHVIVDGQTGFMYAQFLK